MKTDTPVHLWLVDKFDQIISNRVYTRVGVPNGILNDLYLVQPEVFRVKEGSSLEAVVVVFKTGLTLTAPVEDPMVFPHDGECEIKRINVDLEGESA